MKRIFSLFTSALFIAFLFACQGKPAGVQATETKAAAISFANKTDYICGMEVSPEYTDTCHYNGKIYGFCSGMCKDEFAANPESFLSKEKAE